MSSVTSQRAPTYRRKEPSNIDDGFTQDPPVPKLPVPKLSETLRKYLETLECVVVTKDEFERSRKNVYEFENGVGKELQQILEEFSQHSENWVYDWWLEDMYLKNRISLPVNSNPGMPFPMQNFKTQDDQFRFVAKMLNGILEYKNKVDSKSIPVDVAPGKAPFPMCMSQYERLLTSYRRPELPKDKLVSTVTTLKETGACHVTVSCKGQFFILDLLHPNRSPLTAAEVIHNLREIHRMANEDDPRDDYVGLLTTEQRDTWAAVRQHMIKDETNKKSLHDIETSICVVCLDDPLPSSVLTGSQTTRDVARGHQMLHGGGSSSNSRNRWFDKTFELIVGADGSCGLCYEHSPAEGIVVIQLIEKILQSPDSEQIEDKQPKQVPTPPRKLRWNIDDRVKAAIKSAAGYVDRTVKNLDFLVLRFDDYGREFPKVNRTSPDAYIQLSLQLTIYKIHRKLVFTYESAGTRRFRFGRVDTIRSNTSAALNFAKAMTGETKANNEEKLRLFRKAIEAQTKVMIDNISGQGIDCHLLALRELAKELGITPTPSLFEDPSYLRSLQFRLSTSQVPTITDSFMCYGAVVPDGYGVSYNPHKDDIVFCIASFHDDPETSSGTFAENLRESLLQIKAVLQQQQ